MMACLLVSAPACVNKKPASTELKEGVEFAKPSAAQFAELGRWVAAAYEGSTEPPPEFLRAGQGSAYVALRDHGKLLGEVWGADGNMGESLAGALAKAKQQAAGAGVDMVEVNLAHSFKTIKDPDNKNLFRWAANKHVGIRGLELTHGGHYLRIAPSQSIAAGENFGQPVKRFLNEAGVDHSKFASEGGVARIFENHQVIVRLPSGEAVPLLRGSVYVEPSAVTRANTQVTTDLMIDWMLNNLHDDGRMTYIWLPSTSSEKLNDNNMIRQWMATNALIKVAEKRDDPALWARIAKNIDYNLEHFYVQDGEFGLIKYRNQVKLGALSLAAMAIVTHPDRARWQTQEHGLRRTIAELWHEDGVFDCFYPGRGEVNRDINHQNFYPGETLLLWAQLYRESRDPELLRRFVQSFRYYRDWHLDPEHEDDRRRPAFVPWHTQADFILWETLRSGDPELPPGSEGGEAGTSAEPASTPEGWPVGTTPATPVEIKPEEIAEFVFEMNDWLIEHMEVWDESYYDDEKGRFYSRKKPFGGPHASATGVYVEGIIDAYEMAKQTGDAARRARYALSLSRAIRSVMQIQFVDDIDMYYVTDRERTKGGLRTTMIRNEIRVDNVQHVLMGVLKILDRLDDAEFKTD
jgi:hypothetical protein